MKKLNKPIIKKLPPAKLYLDDIESIYNILKEEKVKSIDITTKDYAVEDIKQLKDLQTNKIHELSIKCSDPYINIEFRPSSAAIYFSEDSTHNRGILSKIEDVINKRKVSLRRSLIFWGAAVLNGSILGGSFAGITTPNSYTWSFTVLIVLSMPSAFYLAYSSGYKGGLGNYSTISLLHRKEEGSFWKRNREQIYVAIISAIISSVVTVLMLRIFQQL